MGLIDIDSGDWGWLALLVAGVVVAILLTAVVAERVGSPLFADLFALGKLIVGVVVFFVLFVIAVLVFLALRERL